jgi:hypothetical protein
MPILLEIWVFMRWCEDLLWDPSEFAHKNQLCSSLKVEFLPYPSHSLLGSQREHIAAMLAARLAQRGELVVDYVRLNILAKREVAA